MKVYVNKSSLEDVMKGVQTRLVASPKPTEVKDQTLLVTVDELEQTALWSIADTLTEILGLLREGQEKKGGWKK